MESNGVVNPGVFGDIPSLPKEARLVFRHICQDVILLNEDIDLFSALFSKQENISLFLETATAAFHSIQRLLFDDIIIRLGRLLDPGHSGGRKNLSLNILPMLFPNIPEISFRLESIVKKGEPIREWRKKAVAHKDFFHSLHPETALLPNINIAEMESLTADIEALLNFIASRHHDAEMYFHLFQFGDGEDLIFWIKTGYERLKAERDALLESTKKPAQ